MRRERRMVALVHHCPVALFARQLERWLEEIHIKPGAFIKALQRGGCGQTTQPSVAGQSTYYCAVLLLDPGLIVFVIGARTGPVNAVVAAIALQGFIDECAVVVG